MAKKDKDKQRREVFQAMEYIVQGLQTGMWGIALGYVERPQVLAEIIEGVVRLYLGALSVYHDRDTAQTYAWRMMDMVEPFARRTAVVHDEEWYRSLTPLMLEQLSKID